MRRETLGILTPAPVLAVTSVLVASGFFAGTASGLAVPVLGFLGLGLTLLLSRSVRWGRDARFMANLMLLGIALRFLALTLIHNTVGPYVFAPDQFTYESWGQGLLAFAVDGAPLPSRLENSLQLGYPVMNAGLFFVFGRALAAPAVVNIFVSVWTVFPLYALVRRILPDNRSVARLACGFTVLFPSLILWSTLNIREAPTIFVVVSAVYFMVRLQTQADLTALTGSFLALAVLTFFREYLTSLVGMGGAAGVLMGRSRSPLRSLAAGSVMLGAVLVTFQSVGFGGSLTGEPTLERAQLLRESFQQGAGSAYGESADVSTTAGAISYLPVGLAYFLLAPFPWEISSVLQAITLPEAILWWAIFPFGIWGAFLALRHDPRSFTVPAAVLITVTIAYAMVESNVGTAYRHRGQILPIGFIVCALGIWHVHRRFQARRAARQQARRRAREQLEERRSGVPFPPQSGG